MGIFSNRRNIRVNRANLMRLMSMGIVDRRSVAKTGSHIKFSEIPFAYAKRICSVCDSEVYLNDDWNFVRHMNYDRLEELYRDPIIKKEKIKDSTITVSKEENEHTIVEETKIEEQEIQDNNIEEQQEILENKEDTIENSEEDVEEIEHEDFIPQALNEPIMDNLEEKDFQQEENEEIVYDSTEEDAEPISNDPVPESEEDDSNDFDTSLEEYIKEAIPESNGFDSFEEKEEESNQTQQFSGHNFNKPTFKKRKRK